jgi:hypothetical protein
VQVQVQVQVQVAVAVVCLFWQVHWHSWPGMSGRQGGRGTTSPA